MLKYKPVIIGLMLSPLSALLAPQPSRAADITIKTERANAPIFGRWVSGTNKSDGRTPLDVNAKQGDVLVIQLGASGAHGIVTIDKKPWNGTDTTGARPKADLVIACGQKDTETAVLKQDGCGPDAAEFNKTTSGTLRIKLRDNFKSDVYFWCTAHTGMMWGIIHLAP